MAITAIWLTLEPRIAEWVLLANLSEETKALEEEAARDVDARKVVAVYPMEVAIHDGQVDPLSVRERIRAAHRTTLTKDWYDVPL